MGSSILYSAINDLDLSDAAIPAYSPPGMPDIGPANQLYGTQYSPASPYALGLSQGKEAHLTPMDSEEVQSVMPQVPLNG
mmetsp:Transcript_2591/g.4347  ORF Transcript_2591/g.4347 Transcript_2591/m.4347 type:complete len:80 (-) Transcript_2591:259-498(-)